MKRYNSLDVAKFICEFLVIAVHTDMSGFNRPFDLGFGIITRFIAPVLFFCSGFFITNSVKSGRKTPWVAFKKYAVRSGIIYLVWNTLYVLVVAFFQPQGRSNSPFALLKMFFIGFEQLWYLPAAIVAVGMILLLRKFLSPRAVLAIGAAFLTVGILFSTYDVVMEKWSVTAFLQEHVFGFEMRNGPFYAFPYICLGMITAEGKKVPRFTKWQNLAGFLVCVALLCVECYVGIFIFGVHTTILWFFVFPANWFLCNFALCLDIKDRRIYPLLREMGVVEYTSHYFFIFMFASFLSTWKLTICVYILSVIFAYLFCMAKKKLKFLKYAC